jgi:hypothetical protein
VPCRLPLCKIENPGGLRLDAFRADVFLTEVFFLLDAPLENLFLNLPASPAKSRSAATFWRRIFPPFVP